MTEPVSNPYKLVPVKPTLAMILAATDNCSPVGCCSLEPDHAREIWEAMLAASPQGEGSSADAYPPQPDALPGDLREKVRGAMKAWAQEDCSTGLKMMLTPKGFCDLETRILSLIQSERGGA